MNPNFKLLQFLQKKPTANFTQIAEALEVTDKTAKAHYDFLLNEEYIGGVRAKYIPESIGLETNTYLLSLPDLKRVELIEDLAEFHNFTTFRNRIMGNIQGLLIQFDVPVYSEKFLEELFIKLEEMSIVESYEKIPSLGIRLSTSPEFEYFNDKTSEWTWDFKGWSKRYRNTPSELPSKLPKIVDVKKKLKLLDIKLLTEITKGSKYHHKQIDFARRFNVTPVQVTRRLNFLNMYVVNYRVLYARAKIQTVDLVLFRGKCSEERKNKLYNLIKKYPIPFDTGFELLRDGFLWRMNIPPAFTSLFSNFLWEICSRVNFYRFDHAKSKLYYFYDQNFDYVSREWRATRKEMYEEPLDWIKGEKI
ncbi:MAG: winged helix-turn-helix domain-containing protein [Asgard group archaeon]|nr:winged helix-turn-helix domain-containing protein [Asgard group archaeon]